MLTWIVENGQVDFGNLMVGLGTLAVAAVSLYVAFTANAYERNRVLVNYTGLWIEELRKAISSYVATLDSINGAATPAERQAMLAKLREQDIYIRLKFDRSDPAAARLFPLLDQVRGDLDAGGTASISSAMPVVELLREVFEQKWHTQTSRLHANSWWRR